MKKTLIGLGLGLIAILCLFFWLLSAASPKNAPQDLKVIEIKTADLKKDPDSKNPDSQNSADTNNKRPK